MDKPGYIPAGTGPVGSKYGKCPNTDRPYTSKGKLRKVRTTLTLADRRNARKEAERKENEGAGQKAFALAGMDSIGDNLKTLRRWKKRAEEYATQEAREAKEKYFRDEIARIAARGAAVAEWLPERADVLSRVADIKAEIGEAVFAFIDEHNREPNADEASEIVEQFLSDEDRALIASAEDPDNGPFASLETDDAEDAESLEDDDDDSED